VKILLVHNYYLQAGGEDVAFRAEAELLRHYGHSVRTYEDHNARIADLNSISIALGTIWSETSRQRLIAHFEAEKPDIVHFQNTFPLISPSAYYACYEAGAAVVQSLQNYRLLCPVATFYRNGQPCVDCLNKPVTWPGILHACYHNSHSHSAVVSAMLTVHRIFGTWRNKVDAYIALTEFGRLKFIEGGLPAHKIFLKPNIVHPDPGPKQGTGDFALFVGRLSEEKGIRTLLAAWTLLTMPLKIAGDGPMYSELLKSLQKSTLREVDYAGALAHSDVISLMKQARILIFPSEWFEGFPLTIAEAFACGLPILASRLGAMAEIIQDNETGFLFTPGDYKELASKVEELWNNPAELSRIGWNARKEYEQKYTPEQNYKMLLSIYAHALENKTRQ
jgi:glycosyltransferase involved in cell wall biosynthesis